MVSTRSHAADDLQQPETVQEGSTRAPSSIQVRSGTTSETNQADMAAQRASLEAEVRSRELALEIQRKEVRLAQLRAEEDRLRLQNLNLDSSRGISTSSTFGLPKPDPPHRFIGKNRGDYDQWARDCERFFKGNPVAFQLEPVKVMFATRYLGKLQLERWERVEPTLAENERNWLKLKESMLNSMGNPDERAQIAYDKIKKAYQGTKTPTELLNYLRGLWEDAGEDREEVQIKDYRAALGDKIRDRLNLSAKKFKTLAEVEEASNEAERWFKNIEKSQIRYNERKRSRSNPNDDGKSGESQRGRSSNRGRGNFYGRSRGYRGGRGGRGGRSQSNSGKSDKIVCYTCNEEGHKSPDCPKKGKEKPASQ